CDAQHGTYAIARQADARAIHSECHGPQKRATQEKPIRRSNGKTRYFFENFSTKRHPSTSPGWPAFAGHDNLWTRWVPDSRAWPGFWDDRYDYTLPLKSCPRIGSERRRRPVAAKIALVTAG